MIFTLILFALKIDKVFEIMLEMSIGEVFELRNRFVIDQNLLIIYVLI